MKKLISTIALTTLLTTSGLAKTAEVQEINLNFLPASRVQLNGDSTLRKYSAATTLLGLRATAKETPAVGSTLPWTPVEVEMLLAVKDLKSGDDTLDEHMQENLKAEKFPHIQLKINSFSFSKDAVTASGHLTVAGVTKPVELQVALSAEGENLRMKGTKTLLMTDFGIDPPVMMLGTIKTRNEIEINFDVICLINSKKKG